MPPSLQAEMGTDLSLCSNLVVPFKEGSKHMDNKNLAEKGLCRLSDKYVSE